MRVKDLSGKKFGMLTVLNEYEVRKLNNNKSYAYWHCVCDCGSDLWVRGTELSYGKKNKCGKHRNMKKKHGLTGTRIYNIYYDMLQRCNNEKNNAYKYYGGRGIKVCDKWVGENGFINFNKWSIENGYAENLTIDRIDVNGDYCPENCRWVEFIVQARNKRNTIRKMYNGKEYAVTELAEMGIEPKKYVSREKSWNKDHLNDPYPQKRIVNYNGVDYTLKELSEVIGISFNTLNTRYSKGFSDKDIIKEVNRLHKYCPVIQKDDHGNIICRFGSIKEASEKTGIRKSGINMCCNGQRKHCGGYVWEKDLESQKCEKRMRILKRHKEGGWIDNRGKLIDEID